jgi:hypothetical protein
MELHDTGELAKIFKLSIPPPIVPSKPLPPTPIIDSLELA